MSRSRLRSLTPLLVVADLQRSLDFYLGKLGFADPNIHGEPPCFAMLQRDGFDLMLSLAEPGTAARPNGLDGVWDIYLGVGDIAAEQAELAAAGVAIEKGPTDTFYSMREIEVLDPDGHRICLAQDISQDDAALEVFAGTLLLGPKSLRLVLKLAREGQGFKGRLDSPDQGAMNLPIDRTAQDGERLEFEMLAIGARFTGRWQGDVLDGTWTQGGKTWPLVFHRQH